MTGYKTILGAAVAAASLAALAVPGYANDFSLISMAKGGHGGPPPIFSGGGGSSSCFTTSGLECWMDGFVGTAWGQGLNGAGAPSTGSITMTFVDDFSSGNTLTGNFVGTTQTMEHGKFTAEEASAIATGQSFNSSDPFYGNSQSNYILAHDFTNETALNFYGMFNVVNASYGLVGMAKQGINWASYPTEQSLIYAANNNLALVSKAAGNDGVAIGTVVHGKIDYLATGLKGASSAIYVGALNWTGTYNSSTDTSVRNLPATSLASYSDYPGSDSYYQNHFLAVRVNSSDTGLAGTSFAAPVITAYAAIVAQKFSTDGNSNTVDANNVTQQLLQTAVRNVFSDGYSAARYGMGEACLACALSPKIMQ